MSPPPGKPGNRIGSIRPRGIRGYCPVLDQLHLVHPVTGETVRIIILTWGGKTLAFSRVPGHLPFTTTCRRADRTPIYSSID